MMHESTFAKFAILVVSFWVLASTAISRGDGPHSAPEPPGADGSRSPTDAGQDPPLPSVAVRVRVPSTVKAGEELEYHLCVENAANGAAHLVTLRYPMPANARFVRADPEPSTKGPELLWRIGTLPAMTYRDIRLVLAPTGPGEIKACARVQYEHGQCVATKVVGPALRLKVGGPSQVVIREATTFQLTIENRGNADAVDVRLFEALPAGLMAAGGKNSLEWSIGTLSPGQSKMVDFQATASQSGKLCGKARASAAGGLQVEAERCIVAGEPKLTLQIEAPSHRYLNLSATYRFTVTNPGDLAAEDVVIVNPMPAGAIFMSASEGSELVGNEVRWSLGSLEPGGRRTLALVFRSTAAQHLCHRVTARARHQLAADAEACTDFLGVSALLMELTDTEDPIEVGAQTSYAVRVRNLGTVPVTQARLVAQVPPLLEIAQVTGPSDSHREGAAVLVEPFVIQPEAEVQFVFRVRAKQPGDARFKIELTADQLTKGAVHEEESTQIYAESP